MSVVISGSACHCGATGSIDNAARAAKAALVDAELTPADISTVINCGVFRDHNLAEPAMCALIQEQAGIGLGYQPGTAPTFGFDLHNGPCGPIDALAVAQAFFATGSEQGRSQGAVLVVAGDAHPGQSSGRGSADFPYSAVGGAWVLTDKAGDEGFGTAKFASTDEPFHPLAFIDRNAVGAEGRSALILAEHRCAGLDDALVETAKSALAEVNDPTRVVCLVSAETSLSPAELSSSLGVASCVTSDAHSSGVMEALSKFTASDSDAGPDLLLFATATPGPSAAAVLYRPPS